jgi:two-component system response regulator
VNKILLVEDNPDDAKLALHAFEKIGYRDRVVLARDGGEALDYLFGTGAQAARDLGDRPAVVLLDLKMPRLDGHEVLRQIRADPRTQYQPVVVLTSSLEPRDIARSYALGANSFIRKSVDFDQFVAAAHQLGLYWTQLSQRPREGDLPR